MSSLPLTGSYSALWRSPAREPGRSMGLLQVSPSSVDMMSVEGLLCDWLRARPTMARPSGERNMPISHIW